MKPVSETWWFSILFRSRHPSMEIHMSVKGKIKEAAGYVEEELYEHGSSVESKKKAQDGRDLRNEGRIEDGKMPKLTVPGTGHKEDENK
jgi:hypothetical protein